MKESQPGRPASPIHPNINPAMRGGPQRPNRDKNQRPGSNTDMPINEMIPGPTVMLIDGQGKTLGIFSTEQALMRARQSNLDLVKVGDGPNGAVCKILDYGKLAYALRKKASHAKKNQKLSKVKEMKLRQGIGKGDYEHKLNQIKGFLADGNKVKVILRFHGREHARPDLGMQRMQQVVADLEGHAKLEVAPKLEGSQVFMFLGPKT